MSTIALRSSVQDKRRYTSKAVSLRYTVYQAIQVISVLEASSMRGVQSPLGHAIRSDHGTVHLMQTEPEPGCERSTSIRLRARPVAPHAYFRLSLVMYRPGPPLRLRGPHD